MRDERALDFGGAEAVAGDVEHVVDAADDPEVAVLVAARAVTGEIHALELAPVRLLVARLVAPDATQHRGPRLADDEFAALIGSEFLAVVVHDCGVHAEKWERRGAGLCRRGTWDRRDHVAAGFRLPPRVHDRAATAADGAVIPHPRLGIDDLADRAEQAQRTQIMLRHPLVAPFHECANRRGCRVENGDAVVLDDAPEAVVLRPVRRAFIHERRRAHRERAIDHVAVAGHPADIGGAPVHVLIAQIENVLARHVRVQQVAAGRVQDALRLSRGAARVEDEKRRLGIQRDRGAFRVHVFEFAVPPHIAAFLDVDFRSRAAEHDHALHGRLAALERVVHVLLQRNDRAATVASIGGDDERRAGVERAILDALRAEPAKHHRVNRADARAGQHRNRGLGHHRHVDDDAMSLLHAVALQHICKAAHLAMELLVSEHALLARLALPHDCRLRAARPVEVTVQAVLRDIELPADEPLCVRHLPIEHLLPRLLPGEFLRFAREKFLGVLDALIPHLLVLRHGLDARLARKGLGRFEDAVLDESGLDVGAHGWMEFRKK